MFDKEYDILGKHALYVKQLASDKDSDIKINNQTLFNRYLDVYLNGAIFGLLYNRTAERETSKEQANIPASAFNTSRNDCVFIYRLVMLLEQSTNATPDERIDRAFRHDADDKNKIELEKNMALFHSHVLGGIEILYEKYTDGCTTGDDYIERIFNLMNDFRDEIQGISYEEKLSQLIG